MKSKLPIVIGVIAVVAMVFGIASFQLEENTTETNESQGDSNQSVAVAKSNQTNPEQKETESEYKILNKEIPPGYSFGNYHRSDMSSGATVTQIYHPNEKASIRFTNQHDGFIKNVTINLSPVTEREIIIGVQEDDGFGFPQGTWLDENAFIINYTAPGTRVDKYVLNDGIKLEKGKVYHIVLESHTTTDPSKPMNLVNFYSNIEGRPLNQVDPDIYSSDPYFNSLFFDGSEWIVENKWPMFMIEYSDGTRDGQPYTLNAAWTVRGKIAIGQSIVPASNYDVSKFGFLISKKGIPPEPLFYGIMDSENNVLATGKFIDQEQIIRKPSWVEITLNESVFFEAGKLYRIYVTSPIPREDNNYQFYGHEFSYDNELGYGGLRHTLTISHDEGQSWSSWNDADATFKITTVG